MNRRGVSPAARLAAFQVPKCSITVCGCTAPPGRPRTRASSASAPGAGARAELREDLLVRVAALKPGAKRRERSLVDAGDGGMRATASGHAIILDHSVKCARAPEQTRPAPRHPGRLDAVGARLALETAAARLVGPLSRAAGRGGGTTLPGKLLWKLDPDAIDALAGRLAARHVVVSATNGKTTTTAMAAAILGPLAPSRLEQLRREPRLGRRLHPARRPRRGAGAVRGRRVRAARGDAARAPARRRRSATSFATSSTATASSSTSPSAGATPSARSRRDDAGRQRRRSTRRRARRRSRTRRSASASTTRASRARRSSTPPTRSTASAAARRTPTPPRTSAISATTAAPPAGTRGRRSTSPRARSSCTGSTASSFDLVTPAGTARVAPAPPRSLQRLQRAAPRPDWPRARVPLDEIVRGLEGFSSGVRPLRAHRGRRPRRC